MKLRKDVSSFLPARSLLCFVGILRNILNSYVLYLLLTRILRFATVRKPDRYTFTCKWIHYAAVPQIYFSKSTIYRSTLSQYAIFTPNEAVCIFWLYSGYICKIRIQTVCMAIHVADQRLYKIYTFTCMMYTTRVAQTTAIFFSSDTWMMTLNILYTLYLTNGNWT